eukprot:9219566-Lingulodinium_polyedra.AAC.1
MFKSFCGWRRPLALDPKNANDETGNCKPVVWRNQLRTNRCVGLTVSIFMSVAAQRNVAAAPHWLSATV